MFGNYADARGNFYQPPYNPAVGPQLYPPYSAIPPDLAALCPIHVSFDGCCERCHLRHRVIWGGLPPAWL